jgi:hypothetical protein
MFWTRLLLAWTTLLALAFAPASASARASVIAKSHVGAIDVAVASRSSSGPCAAVPDHVDGIAGAVSTP